MEVNYNQVNVVYVTDTEYIMQTAVSLHSAIRKSSDQHHYNFYLLMPTELETSDRKKIESMATKNASINILVNSTFLNQFTPEDSTKYRVANETALLKFYIASCINEEKILYIDGDTIINRDLADIYNFDLGSEYIGAVRDMPQVLYKKQLIGSEISGRDYFNSGVMLFNLRKIREENIVDKLVETKKTTASSSGLMDQDVFNFVFKNKIKQMPIKYNVCYMNLERSRAKYAISDINKLYNTTYTSINDIFDDAYIIHYSSKSKPWVYYDIPLADLWLKTFLSSPYKTSAINRTSINDKRSFETIKNDLSLKNADVKKNVIPIAMCFNNRYAPYAAVAIQSIIETADNAYNYEIYILHDSDLSESNKRKLIHMSTGNVIIDTRDVSKLAEKYSSKYSRAHYSIQMYYRWFIPNVLIQYNKVIYLDCDLIVREDLSHLYALKISDTIGAVCNYLSKSTYEYVKNELKLDPMKYYNTGVLCINTKKFILNDVTDHCFDIIKEREDLHCPDQDALNMVCEESTIIKDSWNFQWQHFWPKNNDVLIDEYKKRFSTAKTEAKIIHYTSGIKPWKDPKREMAEYFWMAARKTIFYEEILYRNTNDLAARIINNSKQNKESLLSKIKKLCRK